MPEVRPFDPQNYLKTAEDRAAFLDAILEDGDPAAIASGLGEIAKAIGVSEFSRQTGISREAIYKGFAPGGLSLHNMMLPHGPDRAAFEGASNEVLHPVKQGDTMQFMFETRFPQHLTEFAVRGAPLQDDYIDCWASLEKKFDGTPGVK